MSTGLQFFPRLVSYVVINSSISDPHNSRTRGESACKSCSFQRRYTVTGLSPRISCSELKSARVNERTTVSVKNGCSLVVSVAQQDCVILLEKSACSKSSSRNWLASV